MTKTENIEQVLKAVEIHEKIVNESTEMESDTKSHFLELSKFIKECLKDKTKIQNINSHQIKSLRNELLTFWNETISVETEKFWTEIKNGNLNLERKEPLKFALNKNRFRNVEQGIGARKYWSSLKSLESIKDEYSDLEIKKIDKIIVEDENKRIGILKKCLAKKNIPKSQYLKFGECMAYFANCDLFNKYLTEKEVTDLYTIWKNFKS
ncbi:hypothetical protein Q4512_16200 [Oceanihabitans sp. 2_MG-2023]|uniref:hypothetical protein n=1 Tax=Oceanihabitans sp. 2_MG-2023 TaxID=3062661 RepID=UPI0026E20AB6|nr:hypothetical protein [Oceanihabitans sp. 2_MG-2023]MDO6598462.1 hypothetical protein [Oceanihabitans sp. 2_MG-2023]